MKKLFIIAFSLLITMGATDVAAQSLLKKFGDAVKKEIQKEVKKEVNKAVNYAADKAVHKVKDGVEKNVELIRRPHREETTPHAPEKWAPHTPQGQKQAEEARIAKFEFIKEVDLYFADGSTKGTHKVFNDGEGLCVEIKEKHYKITPCNEEFFGVPHYGQCTYMGMDLYIREQLSGLDATASVPAATEKAIFGTLNGHDWVDLGLPSGTKWATCNIGATSPEKPGNLYAWGESTTKSEYSAINYSLYGQLLREISGTSLDTATKLWGEGWRMPTHDEFNELLEYCDWTYTEFNGRIGAIMTSRVNQQSIFLPAGGSIEGKTHHNPKTCGGYWTGTAQPEGGIYNWIYGAALHYITAAEEWSGQSIRPVTK